MSTIAIGPYRAAHPRGSRRSAVRRLARRAGLALLAWSRHEPVAVARGVAQQRFAAAAHGEQRRRAAERTLLLRG